jgi:broad specificity phosphatase PhoE
MEDENDASNNKVTRRKKYIFLVRHGETDYNLQKRVQGRGIDARLNTTGLAQAFQLAQRLKYEDFDFIACSSLTRTIQTAEIIMKVHYKGESIPLQLFDDLQEMSFGVWEGKRFDPSLLNSNIHCDTIRMNTPLSTSINEHNFRSSTLFTDNDNEVLDQTKHNELNEEKTQSVVEASQKTSPTVELKEKGEIEDDVSLELNAVFTKWARGEVSLCTCEGAESPLAVATRAIRVIRELLASESIWRLLVVSHGRLLKALLATLLMEGLQYMGSIEQTNAALNILEYDIELDRFSALTLNCTSHLDVRNNS